jgi:hypothetical protein
MAIPWAAHQQDAELLQELATESLPMAVIGQGQCLLHLHRQLVLELEQLAQKAKGPGVLR